MGSTVFDWKEYGRCERRKSQVRGSEAFASQKPPPITQAFVHLPKGASHTLQ